jgi:hypothetical protein
LGPARPSLHFGSRESHSADHAKILEGPDPSWTYAVAFFRSFLEKYQSV